MAKQTVRSYKRKPYKLKGKTIKPKGTKKHLRRKRPSKGKKRIVSKKAVRLFPIRDEFGQILGYKKK